ncbi:hypothetical protein [Actinoplanes subglobosus]|uniref:RES domain-containing protein n=1 Tax=Actinoplanes subglobosus TaxID=1547892 RepID=A0ABV8J408_9ACTN
MTEDLRPLFGDRATFAVEAGPFWHAPDLRAVDLWAGGQLLTYDDNIAYLPSFRFSIRTSADQMRRRALPPNPYPGLEPAEAFQRLHDDQTGSREECWLMQWGPTTDGVILYAYLDGGDNLVLLFSFWRPDHPDRDRVHTARIPAGEFTGTLDAALGSGLLG